MDIKSNLFAPPLPPTQTNGSASEARRAFEAMLTASAARTRMTGAAPVAIQDSTLAAPQRQSAQVPNQVSREPAAPAADAPSRPGRVLDIKV
jgi:hypothetical protein